MAVACLNREALTGKCFVSRFVSWGMREDIFRRSSSEQVVASAKFTTAAQREFPAKTSDVKLREGCQTKFDFKL